jgi:cold shock protein
MRERGTIKTWIDARGFGFIRRAGGRDVFVHARSFNDKFADIVVGLSVEFEVTQTDKGLQAVDVELI